VLKKPSQMSLWWNYVAEFNTTCEYGDEECSNNVMKKVGIGKTEVEECLVNSVMHSGNILVDDNLILKKEREERNNLSWYRDYTSGLVVVNKKKIKLFKITVILTEICKRFNKIPEYCQEYFKEVFEETKDKETENGRTKKGISAGILTVIIFACLLPFILLVLYFYRRWRRRNTDERTKLSNISASNHFELSRHFQGSI
jgi:hypothetical protein